MSRPVAIRANYRTDAAFLLRLEEAVEKDPRQSESWKKKTRRLVRGLTQQLLTAEQARVRSLHIY